MRSFFTRLFFSGARGLRLGVVASVALLLPARPAAAQTVYGLAGGRLISFAAAAPGTVLTNVAVLLPLAAGQTLVGLDFRPNTGQLYALGYNASTQQAQLYLLNRQTGLPLAVGPALALNLGPTTTGIGFDFDPARDQLLVSAAGGLHLRLDPALGTVAGRDPAPAYAAGDPGAGQTPQLAALGHANAYAASPGGPLYGFDFGRQVLVRAATPASGELTTVGSPGLGAPVLDLDVYFDAVAQANTAYLVANPGAAGTSNLYTLSLTTGQPVLVGSIGFAGIVRDVAVLIEGAPALPPTGQLLYAMTGSNLISFDSDQPALLRSVVPLAGLAAGQRLLDFDFRPATGQAYALGYNAAAGQGQLYLLDETTGQLSPVGPVRAMGLGTASDQAGVDFNPLTDRLRVVSTNRANLRLSPTDGSVTVDRALAYAGTDAGAGQLPAGAGAAHSGSAVTATVLYDYERTRQALVIQNPANNGTLQTVGLPGLTANPAGGVGFDIFYDAATATNAAYLALAPDPTSPAAALYVVDLTTGTATARGRVGAGLPLAGLAASRRAEFYVWTGLVSTSWGTAANWLPPGVPTAANDVLIPRVPNQPTVADARQANNVLLDSSAVVTLGPAGLLTLSGLLGNFYGRFGGTGELRFGGSGPQALGGTALAVPNLTVGPSGLALGGPLSVSRRLRLKGDLLAVGFPCTLLSDASGTAYVVNAGGTLSGPVTVERYIDPSLNPGSGYRHYAAPTSNARVLDLTASGFVPTVNPAYNTATAPGTTAPFPTVFGYDEARLATSPAVGGTEFDKGWVSPSALTSPLEAGRGYTVQLSAAAKVSFLGALNQGDVTLATLPRGPQADAGWQLLGNPYPSPLNWDRALAGAIGLDPALYVFKSSGPYAGTYASYANGVGANGGGPTLPLGQGFFVRTSTAGQPGRLQFTNAARDSTLQTAVFQRGAADLRPLVRLQLAPAAGVADELVVYCQAGATAGFDPALEACKLPLPAAPSLAAEAGAAWLAIAALPVPAGGADVVVPLRLQAPAASPYTLRLTAQNNLPAGYRPYLRDQQTGQLLDLTLTPALTVALAAATPVAGRFELVLSARTVLATSAARSAAPLVVYPNPARDAATVLRPAALVGQSLHLSLFDALGREVRCQELPAASVPAQLPLVGLAPGLYTVRLLGTSTTATARLAVQP